MISFQYFKNTTNKRVNLELYICGKYLLKIRIKWRYLQIYARWKNLLSAHLHNKKCRGIIHPEGKWQQTKIQIYRKKVGMINMWVNTKFITRLFPQFFKKMIAVTVIVFYCEVYNVCKCKKFDSNSEEHGVGRE